MLMFVNRLPAKIMEFVMITSQRTTSSIAHAPLDILVDSARQVGHNQIFCIFLMQLLCFCILNVISAVALM